MLPHYLQEFFLDVMKSLTSLTQLFAYLRMWELENEENYILHLDGHSGYDPNENITCLAYSEHKGNSFLPFFLFLFRSIYMNEIMHYSCFW